MALEEYFNLMISSVWTALKNEWNVIENKFWILAFFGLILQVNATDVDKRRIVPYVGWKSREFLGVRGVKWWRLSTGLNLISNRASQ